MKTIKKAGYSFLMMAIASVLVMSSCKKDKNDPSDPEPAPAPAPAEKKYTLVIENGAQSVEQGKQFHTRRI